jgi:hypothetical protein
MRKLKLWHFFQHGSAGTPSAILGALRVLCVLDGREVLPLLRSEGRVTGTEVQSSAQDIGLDAHVSRIRNGKRGLFW